jgi:hypothetical protein
VWDGGRGQDGRGRSYCLKVADEDTARTDQTDTLIGTFEHLRNLKRFVGVHYMGPPYGKLRSPSDTSQVRPFDGRCLCASNPTRIPMRKNTGDKERPRSLVRKSENLISTKLQSQQRDDYQVPVP